MRTPPPPLPPLLADGCRLPFFPCPAFPDAAAAVPAVPRTVMEDGKTIWGAWDWEGPAHDAANAAADVL